MTRTATQVTWHKVDQVHCREGTWTTRSLSTLCGMRVPTRAGLTSTRDKPKCPVCLERAEALAAFEQLRS